MLIYPLSPAQLTRLGTWVLLLIRRPSLHKTAALGHFSGERRGHSRNRVQGDGDETLNLPQELPSVRGDTKDQLRRNLENTSDGAGSRGSRSPCGSHGDGPPLLPARLDLRSVGQAAISSRWQ